MSRPSVSCLLIIVFIASGCSSSYDADQAKARQQRLMLSDAQDAYHQDRATAALVLARRLVTEYPDFARGYLLKAKIERKLKMDEQAIETLDKAIALDKSLAEAHLDRGICLRSLDRLGESELAIDNARELLLKRLESGLPLALTRLNLAMIAHLQGNSRSALDQVELILTSEPDLESAVELKKAILSDTSASDR